MSIIDHLQDGECPCCHGAWPSADATKCDGCGYDADRTNAVFMLSYQLVDCPQEREQEFATSKAVCDYLNKQQGLIEWHSCTYGEDEIDPYHFCDKHLITTGEGDICHMCEQEFENAVMLINLEMSKHQYSLWFVLSKQYLLKCPVSNFNEAKMLAHSLSAVTGVRIARHDPTEGCESVLYEFKD